MEVICDPPHECENYTIMVKKIPKEVVPSMLKIKSQLKNWFFSKYTRQIADISIVFNIH
jgi:hypothetical protein